MSDLVSYCTVGGLCYDLATGFLLKVPWNTVLKEVVVNTSKKVWSNRNSFKLVLKEADMAKRIHTQFKDTVNKIEKYQRDLDISICSLDNAKTFLLDFEKVLELYDPKNLGQWENNAAGDTLRQQLQYYITYMHSIMSNIHLEISFINLRLSTIQMERDPEKRVVMMNELKGTCHSRYGNISFQRSPISESIYFDVEE